MTKIVKSKDRKISILVGLTTGEIEFLDHKVIKKDEEKSSRSALIRLLVQRSMLRPELFNTGWEAA